MVGLCITPGPVFTVITAPCPAVEPWAAIVIGLIGGVIYYYGVKLLEKLLIDDVVLGEGFERIGRGQCSLLVLWVSHRNWGERVPPSTTNS